MLQSGPVKGREVAGGPPSPHKRGSTDSEDELKLSREAQHLLPALDSSDLVGVEQPAGQDRRARSAEQLG
jgi:hypothetical protein